MTVVGGGPGRAMEPQREREGTLAHVIETLLDKGLVLNADIMVSVAGVELLGIRIRAALASFDTAARYGLEFPSGTDTDTVAWRAATEAKETCPSCGKASPTRQLLEEYCPWCGWRSAQALRGERTGPGADRVIEAEDPDEDPDEDSGRDPGEDGAAPPDARDDDVDDPEAVGAQEVGRDD
ncbi:gas vesicle protein [Puerhibacterium puerhi]|uniref:gas vesicle protein n=1 Tax=Puerhibacterium puerhi TaxID=2692623 RepID=UPI002E2E2237|nr:gas vesicle protein [Puerhibacterium puerhi]